MPLEPAWGGMCASVSNALGKPKTPLYKTKLVPLDAIGLNETKRVHGDEASVDFKQSLDVIWGSTEPMSWDSLEPDKTWVWYIPSCRLEITTPSGTTIRQADTWSDLMVSLEVLESHQFIYEFTPFNYPNAYMVAERPVPEMPGQEKHHDELFNWDSLWADDGNGHDASQLYNHNGVVHNKTDLSFISEWFITSSEPIPQVLLQEVPYTLDFLNYNNKENPLFAKNSPSLKNEDDYDVSLENAKRYDLADRPTPEHEGLKFFFGKMLWGIAISLSLFRGIENLKGIDGEESVEGPSGKAGVRRNFPIYEPWMLWGMWKWLQKFTVADFSDRIFDLSPNWGDT